MSTKVTIGDKVKVLGVPSISWTVKSMFMKPAGNIEVDLSLNEEFHHSQISKTITVDSNFLLPLAT